MELHQLASDGQRVARVPLDLGRPGEVTQHIEVRCAPWIKPIVTPEYAGWTIEPWPSTKSTSVPPRPYPSTTSRSVAPAMKSETTASTAIPHPAIAMPVCPVGTNCDASPRSRAARSSSSDTVIFPIAQSDPTVRTMRASSCRFSPVGTSRSGGRPAQVAELDAVSRSELGQLRVVGDELVQAVLEIEALRDAALQQLAPRGREAATLRRDADERGRRVEAERVVDAPDDRDAVVRLSRARRVEDRDDRLGAVREDAARGLAVVRVVRATLSEDQVSLL